MCGWALPGADVRAATDVPFNPLPTGIGRATRFQPFAGCGIVPYTGAQPAKQGYWFTADALFWYNRGPAETPIGDELLGEQHPLVADGSYFRPGINSVTTGMLGMMRGTGGRFEFGYSGDHWGWMVGGISMNGFTKTYTASDAEVLFRDQYTTMAYFPTLTVQGPFSPVPFFKQVGLLDGFTTQDPLGTGVDSNLNQIFSFGRYWDGDASGDIDPTNAADVLQPQNYDLGDLSRLATVFRTLTIKLRSDLKGVELMPYYRTHMLHKGGYLDFMFGARYARYNEQFSVYGYGERIPYEAGNVGSGTAGNPLAIPVENYMGSQLGPESYWLTTAANNLVGPQVGLRWFREKDRIMLSAEGRFMAAANIQNISQTAHLETPPQPNGDASIPPASADPRQLGGRGANTLLAFTPRTAQYVQHNTEFTALGEVRANIGFRMTSWIVVRAGWTGIWANRIARPSNMVYYALPAMGIQNRNTDTVFLQGLNLGVEINR